LATGFSYGETSLWFAQDISLGHNRLLCQPREGQDGTGCSPVDLQVPQRSQPHGTNCESGDAPACRQGPAQAADGSPRIGGQEIDNRGWGNSPPPPPTPPRLRKFVRYGREKVNSCPNRPLNPEAVRLPVFVRQVNVVPSLGNAGVFSAGRRNQLLGAGWISGFRGRHPQWTPRRRSYHSYCECCPGRCSLRTGGFRGPTWGNLGAGGGALIGPANKLVS